MCDIKKMRILYFKSLKQIKMKKLLFTLFMSFVLTNIFAQHTRMVHKVDKFDGSQTWIILPRDGIGFMKKIKGNDTTTLIIIQIDGNTLSYSEIGVFLLFSDGTKFSLPNQEVDVASNSSMYGGNYMYRVLIPMNKSQIKLLLNKRITDVKLGIFTGSVRKKSAKLIQGNLRYLTSF